MLHSALLISAFVLTLTGAFYEHPKMEICWIGVACFILSFLI